MDKYDYNKTSTVGCGQAPQQSVQPPAYSAPSPTYSSPTMQNGQMMQNVPMMQNEHNMMQNGSMMQNGPMMQNIPMMPMMRSVGPHPATIVCSSCRAQVVTRVEKKVRNQGHIACLLLCLLACWPCCLIPYCMDSCHNVMHYCPHCNAYIGS